MSNTAIGLFIIAGFIVIIAFKWTRDLILGDLIYKTLLCKGLPLLTKYGKLLLRRIGKAHVNVLRNLLQPRGKILVELDPSRTSHTRDKN
ncbi:MAG TPA: hypothetical protein VF292_08600 [Rhodanobacteraceae bacterium]